MTRNVRPATTEDVWAVHEAARASWHAAYDEILGPERVDEIVDEWYGIGDLESSIDASARDGVAFLVAGAHEHEDVEDDVGRADCACVGFAHAVPWPEDTSVAYLAGLYVRPAAWREGTGTALLERLETVLDGSFGRMRSAVLAANDVGVSFAESAGFEQVATRETGLTDGLEENVYEKRL